MRVLHVITGLEAGGAEQQLALLVRHTSHTAEVVSLTGLGSVGRQMLAHGVPVHTLQMRGNRDLGAVRRLAALMRRGAFDVVHVHLYRACVYGRLAARLAGVPVVVTTEHSLGDTHLEGRPITGPIRALYLATARLSHITIAVSPKVEQRLIDWGLPGDRIVVVPNGLDVPAMRFDQRARDAARREFGIPAGATVIGSVGRLHPIKRFDALIAGAAPQLRDGAHLLLVGVGPERQRLEEQARSAGVADRLSLPGERSDVGRLLAAMDVYAAPSREETFGLAVLEALAAGLPVVVGQCPALDGLELPQVERIGAPDELPEALARSADRATGNGSLREPPQVLLDRFGIRAVAQQIDALYERLGVNVRPPRRASGPRPVDGHRPRGTGATTHVYVATDLQALEPEWEALAERTAASPFVRPGWIEPWSRAFTDGPLRVLCARRDGELVAVLPLLSSRRRVVSPTNYETPMFGLVAADAEAADRVLEDLLRRRPRSVELAYVSEGSLTEKAVERAAAVHGYPLVRRLQLRSPHVDLRVGWERYQERFSSRRRKSFRRARRQLEKTGELRFDIVRGGAGLTGILEECLRVEASGWKGELGTAMTSRPAAERFYTEVALRAAANGTLVLTTMRVADHLVAFDLSLQQGDTLYSLKIGIDDDYRKGSPGIVLTYEVVRRAFESGCTVYDWLGDDEPWKDLWTDGYTKRSRLLLLAPSPLGHLTRVAIDYGEHLPDPVVAHGKVLARRILGR